MTNQLQKAYLEVEDRRPHRLHVQPDELLRSRRRTGGSRIRSRARRPRRSVSPVAAGGTFSLSLMFDTTEDRHGGQHRHTNKLLKLMDVDTSLPGLRRDHEQRPPAVGEVPLGNPHALVQGRDHVGERHASPTSPTRDSRLRATVDLSLEQYEPDANWGPQNPTSGTPKPKRTHQVQVGDTLDRIAARYFGDSTKWRDIATLNGIADPLDLTPGRLLSIPERGA